MVKLIKNANVITPYEILANCNVLIKDGKIKSIHPRDILDEGQFIEVIDAEDNYLSPGFIDIHNHGNSGYDFMDATLEAISSIANFHVKNGVTSFLATTITSSKQDIISCLENVKRFMKEQDKNTTARLLGVYLEGPYFNLQKRGAQPSEFIKNPDIEEIKEFVLKSGGNIKIVSLAPELEGVEELLSFLVSEGIVPFAGHTKATYHEMKNSVAYGLRGATHLFNGMRDFNHREPGVIGAALTDERVICEIICDGVHIHEAAMRIATDLKGKNGIILVSDSMMATGLNDGDYILGVQIVTVKDSIARIKGGSLAGSTLTLNKAVKNMTKLVNIPLENAVRMATLNPAKLIGVEEYKGSIELGKDADIVIFDNEINVKKVMISGEIV